jgi:hypothetical protein
VRCHNARRPVCHLLGALALCAGLAGCSSSGLYLDRRETISLSGPDAVATNKVAQMIDPWPWEAANRDIAFNGERIAAAVARYRTGRTTALQTTSTSSVQYQPVLLGAAPAAPASSP